MVMTSGGQGRTRGKIKIGAADPSLTAAGGMQNYVDSHGAIIGFGITRLLDWSTLSVHRPVHLASASA